MPDDSNSGCVLRAKTDNAKNLSQLLKCINFSEIATCFASSNGLKVVVEDAKCVQAAVFFGTDIFEEYELNEEIVSFRINLNVLIECLTIFDSAHPSGGLSTQAVVNVYYKEYGSPLRLILLEDDFVTDCSIKTMDANEVVHFNMPPDTVCNKVIADGAQFKDLFNDLDPSSEYIDLLISPDPPYFRLTTLSNAGKCQMSVPRDADMIDEFVSSATSSSRYKYSQIKPALKPIQASSKVSLQTDAIGLLCLQFMVKTESKQFCYIEYYCTPVIMDDSE